MAWKKTKVPLSNFFVSIGAGLNQIPLITEARKLGFHVIGVDNNITSPGFMKCDLKIQESIDNYNVIYTKLRELLVDGNIHGIMTKSYGDAIKTTSFLTKKFDIPFLPFDKSDNFIHKNKMKSNFSKNKILSPHQFHYNRKNNSYNVDMDDFPVIMKPNIGHAKFNVRVLNNLSDLKNQMSNKKSFKEDYILEKYIEGDEIIAIGLVHNSKYYLIDITDKKTSYPPYFVDLLHTSPTKHIDLAKNIHAIGQSVADAFNIFTSPLIMEIVISKDKELFLIEAVPEFGGEFLPDKLVPARTGYNFIRESIKAMTGKGFKPPPPLTKIKNCVAVKYITGEKGKLVSFNPLESRKTKNILYSRIFKDIGANIIKPVTNLDRIGVVVTTGRTTEQAVDNAEIAAKNFNIRIK